MGCGASTAQEQKPTGKTDASGHSTSTAYVHQVEPELSDDDVPMTEEQLKLIEEIDARTAASTAESASEPGDFKISVRIGVRCAKARILHGIDGSCEAALPKEMEASSPLARAGNAASSDNYGELKPRQIKKIQEWVDRVRFSSNGRHSPVPERYGSKNNLRIDVSDSFHGSTDGMLSPLRETSTPRSQMDNTPRSEYPTRVDVSDWGSRHNTPGFNYTDVDDEVAGHTPRLGRLPEAEC